MKAKLDAVDGVQRPEDGVRRLTRGSRRDDERR